MDHENGGQSRLAPLCHLSSEKLKEEWLWSQNSISLSNMLKISPSIKIEHRFISVSSSLGICSLNI